MELPAPGRFSMTMVWPTCFDTSSNTIRAITSVALPAVSGTTTLIGLVGQAGVLGEGGPGERCEEKCDRQTEADA